jgi:hypothetical protein
MQISVTRHTGVLCSIKTLNVRLHVRLHGVSTAFLPRPNRVLGVAIEFARRPHGVRTASARRSPATPRRSWRFYHDLTASLAFLLSLHGVHTASARRPHGDHTNPRRPRCDYKIAVVLFQKISFMIRWLYCHTTLVTQLFFTQRDAEESTDEST